VTALAQEPRTALPSARPYPTPRPTRARPDLVLALIALGAVGCVALWWHNTPSVSGLGDWLTNAGRVTGLLAGYAMVVLVALMARIPPLERGIGADRLARWHAMGGRYSVCLVVAHGLLITWGYAVTAHTDPVSEGKTLLLSYPDVLMGTVAGLLLVGVGLTSMRAARRKLSYETWYFLHFYTYLAIALAFSHQFATGAEFMTNPTARWAWSLLYAGVAAAVVWYRVAVPVRQFRRHRMRVDAVVRESADTVSVVVRGRDLHQLHAEPGQFLRFRFLTRDLWWVSSPYSLSAPVHPDKLRITVKDLGHHSRALSRLVPGTRVFTEGPYGAMTSALRTRRKVLLIAGGVGITPLRTLFQALPAEPGDLTLVYRASTPDEVVFRDELERIAEQRGARLHIVAGTRQQLGGDPLRAEVLRRNVPDLAEHDVYVCGPDGLSAAALASLRQAGVPRRRIHHESFTF
jgi:predicted ferric reductase